MPQFKLAPEGFAAVKKRLIIRFVVAFVILLSFFIIGDYQQKNKVNDAATWPFIIIILLIFIFFALKRALKYRLTLYSSYTLVVENNKITRLQQNTPAINIYFDDVTTIQKTTEGQIIINGAKPLDTIYIPPSIENREELEYAIQQIRPINEIVKIPFAKKYNLTITVLFLVMLACVYIVSNKIVVGISGSFVSIVIIAALVSTRIDKNIDKRTKRNAVYWLIILASIITVMVVKLKR